MHCSCQSVDYLDRVWADKLRMGVNMFFNADRYGFTIDFIVFIVQGLSKSKCYTKALDYKVGFILIVFLCHGLKKCIYEFNLNYYIYVIHTSEFLTRQYQLNFKVTVFAPI